MMGIEIIPNWHPIFVHFSVALLSISALLYLAGLVFKKNAFSGCSALESLDWRGYHNHNSSCRF